jgi:uncharacterized protein (UPF0548 family)
MTGRGQPKEAAVRKSRPLSQRTLTYDAVGVTLAGHAIPTQDGYRGYVKTAKIGSGIARWDFASNAVLDWGVKTRSGFDVMAEPAPSGKPRVVLDQRYWLTTNLGPFRVREPVQVVAVIDESDRKGFAYGTLTGHPVSGEEAFIVERHADDSIWLTIRSITQPTPGPWRLAHPALSLGQRCYRRRYMRALTGAI